MSNKEIYIGYTFFHPEKVKRYTETDTIYSTRKGKSYILLHVDSLQKEKDMLTIVINNRHITKKYERPFMINSNRPIMNTKYRISKYLTSVFCGLPINIDIRNKYFLRIRQLLLDKLVIIENRLKKQEKNRQTTTYIKFSYGRQTWYLRKVCQNCRSKVIVTSTPPLQNVFKDFSQVKQVTSKCVSVSYTKKVSMDGGAHKYAVTYSNLCSNKNKWQFTNNGIESKVLIFKHRLKRKSDILKKHYISEKEMEFLVDQVTSEKGYNMLKDNIFINHSFNEEYFFELRKKKEASFERKDSKQEILGRQELITRAEFYQELNNIRDKHLLTTYCNGVRRGKRARGVTHDYVVNQYAIKARKLEQDMLY
ncbi:hypothetical protein RhiirC2_777981 [Rhizophagus irregularis]|uniref:Uncharacterized protein n=1 Tax=Rhizophagus irregularis TaxID=588596 RepID=A0A2N1ND46_9GLOM|nr:hypothetical protein RhiirC2_777981 [Rhizophagus irregularis]